MAAARCWRPLLRGPRLSLHIAANAAATATETTCQDVAATPVARYPPIVASMTADSKAARLRRIERWQATVHAAESVDEKLRILTKMQFMKYMVYPQTFALNADRWYQYFTKTVFLSGLPPPPAEPEPEPEPEPALDLAALRAVACDCLLQEHFYLRRRRRVHRYEESEVISLPFLDQLVSTLVGLLSPHNPALAAAALGEPWIPPQGGRERWGLYWVTLPQIYLSSFLSLCFVHVFLVLSLLSGVAWFCNSHCVRNLETRCVWLR